MKCNCGKGGQCSCGGMAGNKNKMSYGGMAKKKMNMGGYCGASNPAARPMKAMKGGYVKK